MRLKQNRENQNLAKHKIITVRFRKSTSANKIKATKKKLKSIKEASTKVTLKDKELKNADLSKKR